MYNYDTFIALEGVKTKYGIAYPDGKALEWEAEAYVQRDGTGVNALDTFTVAMFAKTGTTELTAPALTIPGGTLGSLLVSTAAGTTGKSGHHPYPDTYPRNALCLQDWRCGPCVHLRPGPFGCRMGPDCLWPVDHSHQRLLHHRGWRRRIIQGRSAKAQPFAYRVPNRFPALNVDKPPLWSLDLWGGYFLRRIYVQTNRSWR